MRIIVTVAAFALASTGAVSAQTYATHDQPTGTPNSTSAPQRVEQTFVPAPQAASINQVETVRSVPVYQAYEPATFDSQAYQSATDSPPIVTSVPVFVEQPSAAPVPFAVQSEDLSKPLGSPETFASIEPEAPSAELGFQSETETSRLLLALEETYATRVSILKAEHLGQRKAMLDQFEKDAADSSKVIGLAERMKNSLAELEKAQKAALRIEEKQYTSATLKVLDAAPSRVE